MSWNINFQLTRDEDGKPTLTLLNEFGAPEGPYSVSGHIMENVDTDWGESLTCNAPTGYVSTTINNPRTRKPFVAQPQAVAHDEPA